MTGHEVQCINAATCRVLWRESCPHREPHEHSPICDVVPEGITTCRGVCVVAQVDRKQTYKAERVVELQEQREKAKALKMTRGEDLYKRQKRRAIETKA